MNPLMFYRFLAWFTVFAMPLATWAKEHTLVTAGNGGATASLTIEMIKEPAVWLEVWDVVGDAEGRVQSVSEDHIGFRDLQHGQINTEYGVPQSPEPWRYFRKQTITSTWSRTFQNHFGSMTLPGWESGRMDAVVARGLDKVDTISGAWSSTQEYDYRTAKYRDMYGSWVYDSPIYRMKVQEEGTASSTWMSFPGYRTIGFGGTRMRDNGQPGQPIETQGINVHAAPYFEGGAGPSYWGPEYMRPGYQGGIKNFGESPPSPWSATEAHFETNNYRLPTDVLTNSFTYSLVLSEEDTLAHVQARIEADLAAIPFASIPWGKEREASAGGTKIKEWTAWGDSLWLYNWESSFDPDGYFYQQEGQVRFNVPAALRLPEVGYRARFIEYFSPDSGADQRIVAFHEAELQEGQWESPAFQSTPQTEDGFTILEFFSLAAEAINPHPLMTLVTTDTDPIPPEFLGRRPTFEPRDFAGTGYGTRQVINNSATLQQINLIDSWGSLSEWSEEQVKVTWEILPGSTAGVRLWHWKDDGSPNGVWNRLPADAQLQSYFGSSKDFIFAELTSSGLAGIRITTEIDGKNIFDDIALSSAKLEMAVDANRDGQIKLASEDASDVTTSDQPYRFWINDDIDRVHSFDDADPDSMDIYTETEEDDIGPEEATRDSLTEDGGLNHFADSKRDLEDFSRMQLVVAELAPALARGDLFVGLKWARKNTGNATIRIYENVSAGGGLGYLTNESEADAQKNKVAILDNRYAGEPQLWLRTMVASETDPYILPSYLFQNLSATNTRVHLLFEAVGGGKGDINPVLLVKNGMQYIEVGIGSGISMDLKTIGDMYEHWSVGNAAGGEPDAVAGRVASETGSPTPFSYTATSPEEQAYVLFVHGWNMEKWEKERFAETAYKRLWWQGYKGRFGLFTWPCTNRFDETKPFKKLTEVVTDGTNFDRGEWTAWRSGAPLRQLLQTLNGAYNGQLYVFSHSMGGIVMSEALRLQSDAGGGQIVNVYVASQAALSAHVYDGTLSTASGSANAVQWQYDHPSFAFLGINPGPQNYGPQTPNIYKNWCAYLLSGSATSSSSVGTLVNFYNQNDYALSAPVWQFNQITKPDWPDPENGQPYIYKHQGGPDVALSDARFGRQLDPTVPDYLFLLDLGTRADVRNRYEIMAFAAESYVKSFGATPNAAQGVSFSVDLRGFNVLGERVWPVDGGDHKAHTWHSGQFRSTIQRQRIYWKTLLGADGFRIPTATLP